MAQNPVSYPLGAPVVSGTEITLDTMLNEPTRITRYLSDLTLRKMFSQRIFSNGGSVSGGAVIYDQLTANDLFTDRDVQNVEPGAEFPIVTSSRATSKVAQVEKFGGKFFVTDEARDRNDPLALRIGAQKLANTIQRKTDGRALAVLNAAVTEFSQTATGTNWATALSTAAGSMTKAIEPAADFAKVQLSADTDELGVEYNLWIVNPAQYSNLVQFYGASNLSAVLSANGIEMIPTNRQTAGEALVVEAGQVGEMRFEKSLSTETWREQATERTWVQSSVRPVFVVTNPYSVIKVTGLAG
ncbi:major capsid protein [Nakamurella lactea]|uniref:major capsid protein n=1 Tax=Nakamurella lactea TaxID=459515 RepID=UPI0003F81A2D|nr:major capsid protein [Nakamurella lactea]